MKPVEILKNTKALFFTSSNKLVVSKANKVFLRESDGSLSFLFSFFETRLNRFVGFFPLLFRMKRLGVMTGISVKDDYFFTYGKKIHRYNTKSEELIEEYSFDKGRGPLQFCNIENIKGFDKSVCFGEYFGNHSRNPVKIFQRTESGKWKSPFQFEHGEINHVHALIPDAYNQCVWILVGDFEHSAAIYKATNNFENVELIVKGKQCYRACVAFPTKDGLLYATDTQIESNSVRMLVEQNGQWISKKLIDINGSCIYGCELKNYYIFSTSTEPCDNPKNKIHALLDNKPGPGIIKNNSDIVSYSKTQKTFDVLTSKEKDIFPYRVFQFGTIMFPAGKNTQNLLFAYNVGSKTNDLSTEIYKI
tara:strand:- start:10704 stop:11789 length:1086 start_codon:yes stop_codon:yes gene_type:complete